jgi:hypothetical protein
MVGTVSNGYETSQTCYDEREEWLQSVLPAPVLEPHERLADR